MTLYDTLGVPKDASAEEIKSAFRRNASTHHPDREGGDAEKMAKVNRAYGVLSNPDKREHYDKHGDVPLAETPEAKATAHLAKMFSDLLESDSPSILEEVRNSVRDNIEGGAKHKKILRNKRKKLALRQGRLTVTEGENLFEAILNARIAGIDRALQETEDTLEILGIMTKMLDNWSEVPLEPKVQQQSPYATGWNPDAFSAIFAQQRR